MIRVAIIGAAGYTGGELIRLLLQHPDVGESNITAVSASHAGQPVTHAHPDLAGETSLSFTSAYGAPDVVFLCQGHDQSASWMLDHAATLTSTRVIDLSADHRLDEDWVYGLPELHRERTSSALRVANPGCFATAIQLALLPLRSTLESDVHVTAITGSTGAGQAPSPTTHYSWRANNLGVYKPFEHQHLAEISRHSGFDIILVPMRGSWTRGILASSIVKTKLTESNVRELFLEAYSNHPFTHVVDDLPDLKRVVGTNKCLIGLQKQNDRLLIVSVIDNLLKGASGQAVQNMNLMFDLPETSGLMLKPGGY